MRKIPMLSKNRMIFVISVVIVAMLIIIWAEKAGEKTSEALVTFQLETDLTFHCEVADTDSERSVGLMNRESLAMDRGMLFVFPTSQNVTFWMKNTLIPLDMVFIAENGTVVNVKEAVPEPGVSDNNLTRYSSASPVKWVLEINKGICSENGIITGTIVSIELPEVPV